jgi:hypothetical protein
MTAKDTMILTSRLTTCESTEKQNSAQLRNVDKHMNEIKGYMEKLLKDGEDIMREA